MNTKLKGGYLDFSHITELKIVYTSITEIYMKKQYNSTITKIHKIKQNIVFDGVPSTGYVTSKFIFRNKKALWENQVTNDASIP